MPNRQLTKRLISLRHERLKNDENNTCLLQYNAGKVKHLSQVMRREKVVLWQLYNVVV